MDRRFRGAGSRRAGRSYIEQYMAPADLDDYHPLYKGS